MPWAHPCPSLGGTVGHTKGSNKRMHELQDMQAAFSPCRHKCMIKTCTHGWKPMCTMLWLRFLRKLGGLSQSLVVHGLNRDMLMSCKTLGRRERNRSTIYTIED